MIMCNENINEILMIIILIMCNNENNDINNKY